VADLRSGLVFTLQSIVVGLAVAFVVVLVRPDLLPSIGPAQLGQPTSYADAVDLSAPSVATVYVKRLAQGNPDASGRTRFRVTTSFASAVIIDPAGYLVTNFHVVSRVMFDTVVTLHDGRSTPATLVAFDEANDLAILHINMDDLAPIPRGDDQDLSVGDVVFAIGYPRNIGQSVSQGIVSALVDNQAEESGTYLVQTDAAINPGNSGGALIDRNGNLVGINSSIFSETGRFEGIGFATPVTSAILIMEELVTEAIANNPGYLGVLTGEVLNEETSSLFFGVSDIRGMLVENVDDGGPAQRAGILPGDVITQVDDSLVVDEETIILEFQNKRPLDRVVVQVYRDGHYLDLPTVLGFGQAMVFAP